MSEVMEKVKERPILFSSEMVKAILDGRKTMTRRVIRVPIGSQNDWTFHPIKGANGSAIIINSGDGIVLETPSGRPSKRMQDQIITCPYGKVGDRLWVRETFAEMCHQADPFCWCESEWERAEYHYIEYRADSGAKYPGGWDDAREDEKEGRPVWKPSIFMPRAACRILLEVTGVRVERVQDISESDAKAEGVIPVQMDNGSYRPCFEGLWDTINEARGYGWDTNCWVWVVEFKRIETAADGSSPPVSQKEGV